jgi:hypothetical protein
MVLMGGLGGCPKREVDEFAELRNLLEGVDLAWLARGNRRIGFDGVDNALERLPDHYADHPEVSWRRVRVLVGRGLAAESEYEARRYFAQGRAIGLGCLTRDEEVERCARLEGWVEAAALVEPPMRPCALWAGVAWTRWLTAFGGDAGALDLDTVAALIKHGDEPADPAAHDRAQWTEGLLLALRPRQHGQDLRLGRELLEAALDRTKTDQANEPWVRWRDLLRWGGTSQTPIPPAVEPFTPEDRAAAESRGEG